MNHLLDIFLQPSRAYTDLRERPTWLLPLALLLLLSAILPVLYFHNVDGAWYVQHMAAEAGKDMSPAEVEKLQAMMPAVGRMGVMGAISAVLLGGIVVCLLAVYLMLAGKVTGGTMDFRRGMSLATWSKMPMLLGLLVALIGAARMDPQSTMESLMLTNVDPLLVHLPDANRWAPLARGTSLLDLWVFFLLALGWRVFNRASWLQSAIVALLPSLVFYAVIVVAVVLFK